MSTSDVSSPANDQTTVAELLVDMADLLEIAGENEFKLRAYRNGADVLRELSPGEFTRRLNEDALDELDGIGDALSDKIKQAATSGTIDKFEDTKTEFPVSLLDILDIHGIGPKSVRKMYEELGIENLTELESALQTDTISDLDGFGPKTVENIRESIERLKRFSDRVLLMDAYPVAEDVVSYLETNANPERIDVAGSYRRGRETVGDIDVLVSHTESGSCGDVLLDHPEVEDVLAHGDTKTSVLMDSGLQVDLREVDPESFGAALLYFTGSKEHNVELRGRARNRGWTINEYGVFDEDTGEKLAGETEQSIYVVLDLNWIPPERREGLDEIKQAEHDSFDNMVEVGDIQGDCHMHTTASDGRDSLRAMAEAARELDREYVVFTEHSQSLRVANGLEPTRLRGHVEEIRDLDERLDEIDLYAGTESDILENGELDYGDEVLEDLDLVIAAIHSKFSLPVDRQTDRIVEALKHPQVDVLAHPTGRKLGQRDPYEVRMDPVLETAARENVAVEINSNGRRLDANPRWCRRGKELGVKFVINTDAHATDHLWFTRLGIKTARRGGLVDDDVLNTGSFEELLDRK